MANGEIDLFELLGTPEELAEEMRVAELAAAQKAEQELIDALAERAMFRAKFELDMIKACHRDRRAHCERTRRYSRFD